MGVIALGSYKPSSKSSVSLIGGVIKARHSVEKEKKYPRKDCPVCKGQGWYLSGDGIKRVDCGYCEPEKAKEEPQSVPTEPPKPQTNNHSTTPIFRR